MNVVVPPHVLVVDDNLDAAEALALLIETEGFSAATAPTLKEARERLLAHKPRLILLDLNLPDGSGMSLLAEVKNDLKSADVPVVILSGLADDALIGEARLLGATAFVVKPLDHDRLMSLLDFAR